MRVAIVLGTLATLIDKFIFQPTYLLDENSGLREILCQQAKIDPVKERFTRGILLSISAEAQEVDSEEDVVDLVVDKLLDDEIVKILIDPESTNAFGTELERLVMQFQDQWKIVQHGKQKLETSFDHSPSNDHPWHVLDMHIRNLKGDPSNEIPYDTSILEEDKTVIVPRVYLIGTENERIPQTNGYVLRRTHLDAAEEETRRDSPIATSTQAPSSRQRRRRLSQTATVTSHAHSSSSGNKGERLLSRARGALGV